MRAIYLQSHEVFLETCTPELNNAIASCPSMMIGALLDCLPRSAIGSGFKRGHHCGFPFIPPFGHLHVL